MGEVSSVGVARGGAGVAPHFFEHHDADAARRLIDLPQPGPEAQPDHAAAVEPAGAEFLNAAGDRAVAVANGPAVCGPRSRQGSPVSSVYRQREPRAEQALQDLHPAQVSSESS